MYMQHVNPAWQQGPWEGGKPWQGLQVGGQHSQMAAEPPGHVGVPAASWGEDLAPSSPIAAPKGQQPGKRSLAHDQPAETEVMAAG